MTGRTFTKPSDGLFASTPMDDRTREIEAATGAASLGRLADQVALAAIRCTVGRPLDDSDRTALDVAAAMMEDIASFNSTAVAPTPALLHMMAAPAGVVDEAVEAVTSASAPDAANVVQVLHQLAEDLRSLKETGGTEEVAGRVHIFFDRLSRITLARAAHLASRRTGDDSWMQEALNYLTS